MGSIVIVGLGPSDLDMISKGAIDAVEKSEFIYARTMEHPACEQIKEFKKIISFDELYMKHERFEDVYRDIADRIIEASKTEDVVYAVPGHPRVAELSVALIEDKARELGIDLRIIPSMSFVDAMYSFLGFNPSNGFVLTDAFTIASQRDLDIYSDVIVTQVYDRLMASNVKLALMESYDDEHEIYIVTSAGVKGAEKAVPVKLYELDRPSNEFDHMTSLYIPKCEEKAYKRLSELEDIIDTLRGEDGCPWDKVQTRESIKNHIIEEAYKVADAIEKDDLDALVEELGDVLMQIVFHCSIGRQEGYFTMSDVIGGICEKMISRHPHVFVGRDIDFSQYERIWEEIKNEEKSMKTVSESIDSIPKVLPALIRAAKIQKKAANVGFDWDEIEPVFQKIEEEYKELLDEYREMNIKYIKEELGDLLFSIVNLSRFLKVDPEEALNLTNEKFAKRFEFVERSVLDQGKKMTDMSLEELDKLWDLAKKR